MSARTLYYLHIPKTGGTAFGEYLDGQFDRSAVLPFRTWNQLLASTSDADIVRSRGLLCGSAFVRGHFGVAGLPELPASTAVVTVLREPVARVISQFGHLQRDSRTNNWAPDSVLDGVRDLRDIGDSVALRTLLADVQLRYLSARVNVRRAWLQTPGPERSMWFFDSDPSMQAVSARSTERNVRRALRHLRGMAVVGVQDMLQETMLVAAHRLSLTPSVSMPGLMSAPEAAPRPNRSTQEMLHRLTERDAVLYRAAQIRLMKDYVATARHVLQRKDLSAREILLSRRLINDELYGRLQNPRSRRPAGGRWDPAESRLQRETLGLSALRRGRPVPT